MESRWRFKVRKVRKKVTSSQLWGHAGPHYEQHHFDVMPVDPEVADWWRRKDDTLAEGWCSVRLNNKWDGEQIVWFTPDDQIVKCAHCGHRFYRWDKVTLYCGKACYKAAYRTRHPKPKVDHDDIPCAHCGEEFMPIRSTAKYCSPKCRVAANRAAKQGKAATKRRPR